MKIYLLRETGRPTWMFKTVEAANKAMDKRIAYYLSCHALVKGKNATRFECRLNEKDIEISIVEKEFNGF